MNATIAITALFFISLIGIESTSASFIIPLILITLSIYFVIKRHYTELILLSVFNYVNALQVNFEHLIISPSIISFIFIIIAFIQGITKIRDFNFNSSLSKLIKLFFILQIFGVSLNLFLGELPIKTLFTYKSWILGTLFFFPGYLIGFSNFKTTTQVFILFSVFYILAYFLSYFEIIQILTITKQYLISEAGVYRENIELSQFLKVFIFTIPYFFFKNNLKSPIIFIIGLLILFLLIIALKRTEILYTIIGITFAAYLLNKKLNSFSFLSLLFPFLILLIFYLSFELFIIEKFNFLIQTFNNLYGNLGSLKDEFSFYHRFFEIVPNQINALFSSSKNFLFGTGITNSIHEYALGFKDLGYWDVPITGSLALYGISGYFIYLLIYWNIFKYLKYYFNNLRAINRSDLETVFTFGIAVFFLTAIFFRGYYMMWELVQGNLLVEFYFLLGLLVSQIDKFKFTKPEHIKVTKF